MFFKNNLIAVLFLVTTGLVVIIKMSKRDPVAISQIQSVRSVPATERPLLAPLTPPSTPAVITQTQVKPTFVEIKPDSSVETFNTNTEESNKAPQIMKLLNENSRATLQLFLKASGLKIDLGETFKNLNTNIDSDTSIADLCLQITIDSHSDQSISIIAARIDPSIDIKQKLVNQFGEDLSQAKESAEQLNKQNCLNCVIYTINQLESSPSHIKFLFIGKSTLTRLSYAILSNGIDQKQFKSIIDSLIFDNHAEF